MLSITGLRCFSANERTLMAASTESRAGRLALALNLATSDLNLWISEMLRRRLLQCWQGLSLFLCLFPLSLQPGLSLLPRSTFLSSFHLHGNFAFTNDPLRVVNSGESSQSLLQWLLRDVSSRLTFECSGLPADERTGSGCRAFGLRTDGGRGPRITLNHVKPR